MREVFPGHHIACHLREVQTAAFSEAAAVSRKDLLEPYGDLRDIDPRISRRGRGSCGE
jgi:hypothetical protein